MPNAKTTWLIQAARNPTETVRAIERACVEQKQPYQFVPVVPFSPQLPDLSGSAPPCVFYGYTTLIVNAFHSAQWRSGVFYNPRSFCPSAYQAHWGHEQMVSDFRFDTLRGLRDEWITKSSDRLFVKPDDDLKRFSGGVMTYAEFAEWFASIENLEGEGDISSETRAAFTSPVENIGPEFRVFLVDGRAVTASSYLPHGDLSVPPEVIDYAQQMAGVWQPAPVFVLDVAYVPTENETVLRIVEANCFNGSAFYRADVGTIVRAVSRYQEAVVGNAGTP